MHIIYNGKLKAFQIVHTPNIFINKAVWNKPVNDRLYETWDEASHDIDRWSE